MTEGDLRRTFDIAKRFVEADRLAEPKEPKTPQQLEREIDIVLRDRGTDPAALFDLMDRIAESTPRTSTRRFFNQLFAGRDTFSVAADMLTPLLNNSMYTFKVGGVHVLLERIVLDRMCRFVGFENGDGTLTPGGSLSNLAAAIVARNEALEEARNEGVSRRMVMYSSEEGHYSVTKNAGMIGVGRNNVRLVRVDGAGRMEADHLRELIKADVEAGHLPFMINATAGTTVRGAFDPLRDCADVAREFGVWLHVDGAYGGTVLLSSRHRHLLDGCELADSFTWDAHKMLGVPLIGSAVLTKRRDVLRKHFDESADYLFQADSDELNPGKQSMQCGRRNDAFKIWAVWKRFGDDGLDRRITHLFDLARHAVGVIKSDPMFALSEEPQSTNICFEVVGKSSAQVCDTLDREGRAKVGTGIVKGRRTIRLVTVNPDLTTADIDAFFDEVRHVAARLDPGENAIEPATATA